MKVAHLNAETVAICLSENELEKLICKKQLHNPQELNQLIVLTIVLNYFLLNAENSSCDAGLSMYQDEYGFNYIVKANVMQEDLIPSVDWKKVSYETVKITDFFTVPDEIMQAVGSNLKDDDYDENDIMEDEDYCFDELFLSDNEQVVFEALKLSDLEQYKTLNICGIYEYQNKYYVIVNNTYNLADYEGYVTISPLMIKQYGKKIVKKKNLQKFFDVL